jgi:hypothetical protein
MTYAQDTIDHESDKYQELIEALYDDEYEDDLGYPEYDDSSTY